MNDFKNFCLFLMNFKIHSLYRLLNNFTDMWVRRLNKIKLEISQHSGFSVLLFKVQVTDKFQKLRTKKRSWEKRTLIKKRKGVKGIKKYPRMQNSRSRQFVTTFPIDCYFRILPSSYRRRAPMSILNAVPARCLTTLIK